MANPKDLKVGLAVICWNDNGWTLPGGGHTASVIDAMLVADSLNVLLQGRKAEFLAFADQPKRTYVRRPAGRNGHRWPVSVP